jgi:hypothetical protein
MMAVVGETYAPARRSPGCSGTLTRACCALRPCRGTACCRSGTRSFYEAYATGLPVMRTMWMEFPEDASTFALDAQWMVGSALLVAPVTSEGHKSVRAYLPAQESDGTPINHW